MAWRNADIYRLLVENICCLFHRQCETAYNNLNLDIVPISKDLSVNNTPKCITYRYRISLIFFLLVVYS